jgi:hypothetical protein
MVQVMKKEMEMEMVTEWAGIFEFAPCLLHKTVPNLHPQILSVPVEPLCLWILQYLVSS